MLGETQPLASLPGSIRGDYSIDLGRNICHGSDAPDAAKKELGMWFPEGVNDHYSDLATKPFYPSLCTFFSSGPIVCMCWEGKDIIRQGRRMLGETQPLASLPGSIRGDYSIDLGRNICHGSDAPDAAKKELGMWFPEGVNDWAKTVDGWVYEG